MEQQLNGLKLWWINLHPWVVVRFHDSTAELATIHWTKRQAEAFVNRTNQLNSDPRKGLPAFYRSNYEVRTRAEWLALEAEIAKRRNR